MWGARGRNGPAALALWAGHEVVQTIRAAVEMERSGRTQTSLGSRAQGFLTDWMWGAGQYGIQDVSSRAVEGVGGHEGRDSGCVQG